MWQSQSSETEVPIPKAGTADIRPMCPKASADGSLLGSDTRDADIWAGHQIVCFLPGTFQISNLQESEIISKALIVLKKHTTPTQMNKLHLLSHLWERDVNISKTFKLKLTVLF